MTREPRFTLPNVELGALEPYWHRLRDWWGARSLREQVLLGGLAAVGILALLLLVLAPLREERADAIADIRAANLIQARLLSGASMGTQFRTGAPSVIVAETAAARQLTVEQAEPAGTDIRVVLAPAPFDAVMNWIAEVEATSNLRVRDLTLQGQGAAGYVDATVVLG